MLTSRFVSAVFCSSVLVLTACDKDESLGEVDSETQGESDSQGESETQGESDSDSDSAGETEGDSDSGVGCPADAMICPDGSAVGRSGPDCEFDPCPGDSDGETDSGGDTDGDPPICDEDDGSYEEPASCPTKKAGMPYVIDAGCYEECDLAAPNCSDGTTCMPVEVNPCICENNGDACCGACSAGAMLCVPTFTGDACEALVNEAFLSVEQHECGATPDGVELCNWSISLTADGEYNWFYSDIGQAGGFACKDGVITVDNDPTLSASYDLESGILTWDGLEYITGKTGG